MHVDAKSFTEHPARIADTPAIVDREPDRHRMDYVAVTRIPQQVALLEYSMHLCIRDLARANGDLRLDDARSEETARKVRHHLADRFALPSLRLHAPRSPRTSRRRPGRRSSHCARRGRFDGQYPARAASQRRRGRSGNISLSCRYRGRRSSCRAARIAGLCVFDFIARSDDPPPMHDHRLASQFPPMWSCALRREAPFPCGRVLLSRPRG